MALTQGKGGHEEHEERKRRKIQPLMSCPIKRATWLLNFIENKGLNFKKFNLFAVFVFSSCSSCPLYSHGISLAYVSAIHLNVPLSL